MASEGSRIEFSQFWMIFAGPIHGLALFHEITQSSNDIGSIKLVVIANKLPDLGTQRRDRNRHP
jgi:hypothetical protein